MRIYKASIARAAAPRMPTAWVAWAAPPVNWLAEGVALTVALPAGVLVAAAEAAEEAADEAEDAADSTAEEASERIEEATDAAEEAAEETADAAAEVALATAELASEGAALLLSGMLMGTPAAEQVDSTAEMAAAWSDAEQAPSTQGWTVARREAPFLQWQAKSVKLEHPSLVRGPTKQFN
jgi:hypothetical protein